MSSYANSRNQQRKAAGPSSDWVSFSGDASIASKRSRSSIPVAVYEWPMDEKKNDIERGQQTVVMARKRKEDIEVVLERTKAPSTKSKSSSESRFSLPLSRKKNTRYQSMDDEDEDVMRNVEANENQKDTSRILKMLQRSKKEAANVPQRQDPPASHEHDNFRYTSSHRRYIVSQLQTPPTKHPKFYPEGYPSAKTWEESDDSSKAPSDEESYEEDSRCSKILKWCLVVIAIALVVTIGFLLGQFIQQRNRSKQNQELQQQQQGVPAPTMSPGFDAPTAVDNDNTLNDTLPAWHDKSESTSVWHEENESTNVWDDSKETTAGNNEKDQREDENDSKEQKEDEKNPPATETVVNQQPSRPFFTPNEPPAKPVVTTEESTTTNNNQISSVGYDYTANSDYLVGVYYYPWHGANFHNGGGYMRKELEPKHVPALGEYNDSDPGVIAHHMKWFRQSNIGLLVTSWWGPNRVEDSNTKDVIMEHEDVGNLKIALHYETTGRIGKEGEKLPNVMPDIKYMCENYFDHPNYYRVNGRPALFIYVSRHLHTIGVLEEALLTMRSTASKCGHNLYLIGDSVFESAPDPNAPHSPFWYFDAVTNYDVYGSARRPEGHAGVDAVDSYYQEQAQWKVQALQDDCRYIPAVSPGYNDRGVRMDKDHPPLSRRITPSSQEGSLFHYQLKQAKQLVDDEIDKMILVNSFNEWHEDTQIEPVVGDPSTQPFNFTKGLEYVGYGDLYLDILGAATSSDTHLHNKYDYLFWN